MFESCWTWQTFLAESYNLNKSLWFTWFVIGNSRIRKITPTPKYKFSLTDLFVRRHWGENNYFWSWRIVWPMRMRHSDCDSLEWQLDDSFQLWLVIRVCNSNKLRPRGQKYDHLVKSALFRQFPKANIYNYMRQWNVMGLSILSILSRLL